MQLDADDGGDAFYKPASQPSAAQTSKPVEPAPKVVSGEENDVEAAATATIEQEA